jgi:hypothetical protein
MEIEEIRVLRGPNYWSNRDLIFISSDKIKNTITHTREKLEKQKLVNHDS